MGIGVGQLINGWNRRIAPRFLGKIKVVFIIAVNIHPIKPLEQCLGRTINVIGAAGIDILDDSDLGAIDDFLPGWNTNGSVQYLAENVEDNIGKLREKSPLAGGVAIRGGASAQALNVLRPDDFRAVNDGLAR